MRNKSKRKDVVVVIVGRKNCKWCREARKLCRSKGLKFSYVDLDSPSNADMLNYFKIEGFKTVPQVWIDGDHVGGFMELEERFSETSET
jgi:glutaredoxin